MSADRQNIGLSNLAPNPGARKCRKRLGIGEGSGSGKTCGRGQKGQKSRSGGSIARGFEGGQMPLQRRLPKTGFRSRKRVLGKNVYTTIPVARLSEMAGKDGTLTLESFIERGTISRGRDQIKVLGGGTLKKKLVVEAHAFSRSAKEMIEQAGGEARIVAWPKKEKKQAEQATA